MKRIQAAMIAVIALVLLLLAAPAYAVTVVGTVKVGAAGARFTGKGCWTLSVGGQLADAAILPGAEQCWPISNGKFVGASVVANDAVNPQGTYYTVRFLDAFGKLVDTRKYVVTTGIGTWDIGLATPTTTTNGTLVYVVPVLNLANTYGNLPGNRITAPILLADGTAAAPAYSFASNSLVGLRLAGTAILTQHGSASTGVVLSNGGVAIANTGGFKWSSTTDAAGAPDAFLYRDAANALALRNGTTANTLRVYNTYTDASNYERGSLNWSGNTLYIYTEKAGTGVARDISVSPAGWLSLGAANVNRWTVTTTMLGAAIDNTYDIGSSGANRPRNIYAGSQIYAAQYLNAGTTGQAGNLGYGVLRLPNNGVTAFSSTADANGTLDTGLSRTAAGAVAVGNGTTGDASGEIKATRVNSAVWALTDVQAAINSLPAAGGLVQLLPNKTYTITCGSNQINTGSKTVRIVGAGETSIIEGTGCVLVTLAMDGSTLESVKVRQTTANAATVGVLVASGSSREVIRWALRDVYLDSEGKLLGSGIKTVFGLEGLVHGGEVRGWGCGVELTAYDASHRSNANSFVGTKVRWGNKGFCIPANGIDDVFVASSVIEGQTSNAINTASGAFYLTDSHVEQAGGGTQPQVDISGATTRFISKGNIYAYDPPVAGMDIRTAADNQSPHTSDSDILNGGITHNNTTSFFTVNDPIIDFTTAGAGTVITRRGNETWPSNANFAYVLRDFAWYDVRGAILNSQANTRLSGYAGRAVTIDDYTGATKSMECYPNGDNSCYFWGQINPAGGISGVYRIIGQQQGDGATHTGTTSETVLYTLTIPAGSFGINSNLAVNFWALNGANAGTTRYRVRLGGVAGTVIGDTTATNPSNNVRVHVVMRNRGALNAQTIALEATQGTAVINNGAAVTAINTALSQDLVITAVLGNTADTATIKWAEVQLAK